jgi:uncharacterized membrane protein (UPF0127 family)
LRISFFIFWITLVLSPLGLAQEQKAQSLDKKQFQVCGKSLVLEIAKTPEQRQIGMMYREGVPAGTGMLFIFEQKAGHCFWMSNTKIPLSIAFIGDDSKIVNIEEMQADTTNNHCPKAPIRFALEMNQKWFAERALGPGTLIQGLPKN